MFDAQILISNTEAGTAVFSPWMGRRGDNLIATVDVIRGVFGDSQEAGTLTVRVYHKNSEDTGDGTAIGASIVQGEVGRAQASYSGLKELVRYKFEFALTQGPSQDFPYVQFRMLSPVWFDTVRPSA